MLRDNELDIYKKRMETGTTVVGIVNKDCCVLAADRQSTAFYISSKAEKKVYKINDHVGAAFSGVVGDINTIVRYLKAEASYYEIERN